MSAPQNGAAAYSRSHTYHIFARVVSHYLPCGFRLPKCPPMVGPHYLQRLSSDLTVFSQQPASDADCTCPAYEMLPGYLYLVVAPW